MSRLAISMTEHIQPTTIEGARKRLSMENLISLATILVLCSLAFGSLQGDQRLTNAKLDFQTQRIDEQKGEVAEARRVATETRDSLIAVQADLHAIRNQLVPGRRTEAQ